MEMILSQPAPHNVIHCHLAPGSMRGRRTRNPATVACDRTGSDEPGVSWVETSMEEEGILPIETSMDGFLHFNFTSPKQ